MKSKKIRLILTGEEYNLINEITRQTKVDCWFCLDTDREGFDCVRDLEKGRKVTLRFAIEQLNNAIIPEALSLTENEIKTYGRLMSKLKLVSPL